MRKRSQGQFTHNAKAAGLEGWDLAMSQAEQEIAKHEDRIAKLRLAMGIFQDMKDQGEPFMPSVAESAIEEKAA